MTNVAVAFVPVELRKIVVCRKRSSPANWPRPIGALGELSENIAITQSSRTMRALILIPIPDKRACGKLQQYGNNGPQKNAERRASQATCKSWPGLKPLFLATSFRGPEGPRFHPVALRALFYVGPEARNHLAGLRGGWA